MLRSAESSLRENQRTCFQPGIGESRSAPAKGSPPSPFIVVRRGGVHECRGAEVVVFPRIAGTVVEHCRKCTVRRRRTSLSSWISSLVPWRWRRPSCSVPAVVMARDGPGPPGRSAGVHTRRSGSVWKSWTPRGGGLGSHPYVLSALLGRTCDIIGLLPQREVSPGGGCRQNSNGGGANLSCAALNAHSAATATGVAEW